jgi:hypothetical protein
MTAEVPGIHRVSTPILTRLLRALHRGAVSVPITRSSLIEKAFGDFERDLDALVGLELRAAQAVIASVLKERGAKGGGGASLVYMGPPLPGTRSRDVRDVARELVATATKSLKVLGLRADAEDGSLLSTLAAAAQGRSLSVEVALAPAPDEAVAPLKARLAPLGVVLSRVTGRGVRGYGLLVDGARLLVSSAPLEGSEEDGTLDLGAVIDDPLAVVAFDEEWARLVRAGVIVPLD